MVIDLLYYHIDSGVKLFIIHLQLVGACEGLAHSVLDGPNDPLYCPNTGTLLGEGHLELDGGKFEVEGRDPFHLFLK